MQLLIKLSFEIQRKVTVCIQFFFFFAFHDIFSSLTKDKLFEKCKLNFASDANYNLMNEFFVQEKPLAKNDKRLFEKIYAKKKSS